MRPAMIAGVSETAFTQLSTYIDSRRDHLPEAVGEALARAREDAGENGVPVPSQVAGDLLSVLAAGNEAAQGAVAVTPAAGVAGLHILAGLREKATLTCIEPEAALQALSLIHI